MAYECIKDYLRTATGCPNGVPGVVLVLHTFGEYGNFHPHIHALVADGVFIQSEGAGSKDAIASDHSRVPDLTFVPLPQTPIKPLAEIFRAKIINFLLLKKLLSPESVSVLYSFQNSGFTAHAGESVSPEATAEMESLAQYILRNPFSVKKMVLKSQGGQIIYRSEFNQRIKRNFEVFEPMDFLAVIAQHIPDKGTQTIRYFGEYSNKSRGMKRHAGHSGVIVLCSTGPRRVPSKRWRDLIMRVWHVDPLRCPICEQSMRVVAVLRDQQVVEKILRHLNVWQDPPTKPSPRAVCDETRTYEPCNDLDPMPNYESLPD